MIPIRVRIRVSQLGQAHDKMKPRAVIIVVVAFVLVALALFTFYHAHSILHILHANAQDHARAELAGSRRFVEVVGANGIHGGPVAAAHVRHAGAFVDGAASAASGAALSHSDISNSVPAAKGDGVSSLAMGSSGASVNGVGKTEGSSGSRFASPCMAPTSSDSRSKSTRAAPRTFMLLNRHMMMGFVNDPHTGKLNYFPEVRACVRACVQVCVRA